MRLSFSRLSVVMVFVLVILRVTDAYAESAKVVVIPLGADSLPTGVLSGQEIVSSSTQTAAPGALTIALATCPNGKILLGGGYTQTSVNGLPRASLPNPFIPQASYPSSRDTWRVVMENTDTFSAYFRVYVICAKDN